MKKNLLAIIFCCAVSVTYAQIAVRNELRHHNVFENNYLRILDVWLAPGDTTQVHLHATPSVFISLSRTATGSQIVGQQPVRNISVAQTSFYDSLVTPRIHRVWNEDTTWFHVMDVELTAGEPHSNEPAIENAAVQLLFDAPLARGYDLQLPTGANIKIPLSQTGYLLVSLGEATIAIQSKNAMQMRFMKAGHYCWVEAGKEISISNKGNAGAAFRLLQLK